jgi:membrane fusion protein (multidrug efflux system)
MADVRARLNDETLPPAADPGENVRSLRERPGDRAPAAPEPAAELPARTWDTAGEAPVRRRRRLRRVLLPLGPLAVVCLGLWIYLAGGRYVSTDNAYVRADKLTVATDVSGIVSEIAVRENESIQKGSILFRLDDEAFRIALAGAEARLGTVRNEIATMQANYRQNLAQIEQAKTDVTFYQTSYQRQLELSKRGAGTQAALDQAKRDLDSAQERVRVDERQADATLAQLGGDANGRVENDPRFLQAQSDVDRARRDLNHAVVTAPMAGIIVNADALQVGEYLPAAQPAFNLVATDHVWVEANPKETDLTYMAPGNPAQITVDAYPGREWPATVTSISPATGAEFAVLPAQNASGNWVKVVQRVPVRMRVEMPEGSPSLRSGMSVEVSIDTGHRRSWHDLIETVQHWIGL